MAPKNKAKPKPSVLLRTIGQGWKPPLPESVTEAAYARMTKGMQVAYPKTRAEYERLLAQGWRVQNNSSGRKRSAGKALVK